MTALPRARRLVTGALPVLFFLLSACEGSRELEVRTFTLQHRSAREAGELVRPYIFTDRAEAPGTASATGTALTVRETPDNLEKIARVLEEFDQPLPTVRLHFQLIEADSFQDADPAISDVVEQLRSLFRFEGYRLVGETTVLVGGTGGRDTFTQRFPEVAEVGVRVLGEAVVRESGRVRLDLRLSDPWDDLLETSLTVRPGQTLVIGGTQAGHPSGESRNVILTVRAAPE